MRGGAFFNGKEGRDDFRKTALRAVTSFLLRRKAWLEVELSLQERRRGRKVSTEGGYILPFSRREGLVRMWSSLWLKGDGGFRKCIRSNHPITY